MSLNARILLFTAIIVLSSLPVAVSWAVEGRDVTGQVIDDSTGKPIEGATVKMSSMANNVYVCKDGHKPIQGQNCSGEDIPYSKPVETYTDKDGHFVFTNVPDDSVMGISASKKNYIEPWVVHQHASDNIASIFRISQNMESVSLRLTPLAVISGTVHDATGAPLKGVWVHLFMMEGQRRVVMSYSLNTDHGRSKEDGTFIFEDVRPGKYYIVAEPTINELITASSYRSYQLQGDGTKVEASQIQQNGQNPVRDAKGQALGYVPIRYPLSGSTDTNPFISVDQGNNIKVDLQFKSQPLYHVSGSTGGAVALSVIDSNGIGTFYKVRIDPNARRFDVWLPDGQYSLSDNCCSYDQKNGDMDFKVVKADIDNLNFVKPDRTPVKFKIAISHETSCQQEAFGCHSVFDILFENLKNGTQQSVMAYSNNPNTPEISLQPGNYAIHIRTWDEEYAKEAHLGNIDLNKEPLQVTANSQPETIQLIVSKSGRVEGNITKNGKPTNAWLYALPEKPNVMAIPSFQTTAHYRLTALAPGSYYIVVTDVDLKPNFSDPKVVDLWKRIGKKVTIGEAETQIVDLEISNIADTDIHH